MQERIGQPAGQPTPATERLAPAAQAALTRLDRAFLPQPVAHAVTAYETAALRYDELIARPASGLAPAETNTIRAAQQTMADAFGVLAEAGRTDLLDPLETATRYRYAADHYKKLAATGDYEGCEYIRDEMTMCACQLADAGRLDLIGAGA